MGRDPYEVLGIGQDASLDEAKAAYHELVEIFHPDRMAAMRPAVREQAARQLQELNQAWSAVQRAGVVARPAAEPAPAPVSAPEGVAPATSTGDVGEGRTAPVLYDVELRSLDGPLSVRMRWRGDKGRAIKQALTQRFERGSPSVREVDWGAYEAVLTGSETEQFLLGEVPSAELEPESVVVEPSPPAPDEAATHDGDDAARRRHRLFHRQRHDEPRPTPPKPLQPAERPEPAPIPPAVVSGGPVALRAVLTCLHAESHYRIRAEDF